MRHRLLRIVLPLAFAGIGSVPSASADIYTWVDASGRINISNLDPPEGARVTNVVHTPAPKPVVPDVAARDALRDAEVQLLAERVRQLQDEVAAARRDAARQAEYRAAPPAPVVQYESAWQPPPMQYADAAPASYYGGCDPSWAGCGLGWWPGVYGTGVVFTSMPALRYLQHARDRRPYVSPWPMHGGAPYASHQPVHGGGGLLPRPMPRGPGGGRGH
jgi:hypothetical protein